MDSDKQPSILVVDDTEANIDLLVEVLGDEYEVMVAMDGPAALEIAAEELPDLVLLDVMMPDMDGWEVCERLKSDAKTRDIPVIFVTAKAQMEDEIKGFEIGGVDFITKPISPPVALRRIRSTLDLKENSDRLASMSAQLGKYLSPQVYESIFMGTQDAGIGATRKKLTVFFSDIVGFTATTERMEPEDMTALLNSYLDRMSAIALKHGGTIDKFIGDAVLIFFGDPVSMGTREDAAACVNMALEMRDALGELQEEWLALGISTPFQVRMGINTGYCTVGNFGSKQRMDYTIIGGQVNVAARLEQNAPPDQILISHETWALVKDDFRCLGRAPIYVKGIQHSIRTYQVLGRMDEDGPAVTHDLGEMAWPASTINSEEAVGAALLALRDGGQWACLVVLEGTTPVGLAAKGRLRGMVDNETDKALFMDLPVAEAMDGDPLILPSDTALDEAARKALSREGTRTFDPIIVTRDGEYLGLVTIRCLMQRLLDTAPEIGLGENAADFEQQPGD